jgi:hypothetical protein
MKKKVSSLQGADLVSTNEPIKDDSVSFLGLPYQIWKKIFRYSGVICPCHIALLPVRHGSSQGPISIMGRCQRYRGELQRESMTRPDLVTCAFQKIPEFDDGQNYKHRAHISMLGVSRMARFMTLKAIFQKGSFHFEVRDTSDFDGLERALRGLKDMQPLNRQLKRLHVNFFFSKPQASSSLDVWYYFCDYFGKHLTGTLTHFVLECRPRTVENAKGITASKAISNLKGLQRCIVLFDCQSPDPNENLLHHYVQISEVFVRDVVVSCEQMTEPFRFMDLPTEIQILTLQYALIFNEELYRGPRSWSKKVKSQEGTDGRDPNLLGQRQKHYCCMCSMLKYPKALSSDTTCNCLRERSKALKVILKPKKPTWPFVDMSPVPIFLTNKHIHALSGSIFYSQNKFTFDTDEIFNPWVPERHFVSSVFPARHIKRVRHLGIELVYDRYSYNLHWNHDDNANVKEYKRLATHLEKTFNRTSIDLTLDSWWKVTVDPNNLDKVLAFFDHFEGERPECYRRKK